MRELEHALIAFEMNGEPLSRWHGFPARLVVPGWTATYWVKSLTELNVLDRPFDGFWMKTAYRVPEESIETRHLTLYSDYLQGFKKEHEALVTEKMIRATTLTGTREEVMDAIHAMKKAGIKQLIITGCTTSVCVEATVRDAMYRDYSCVLLSDCMSQPTFPNSLPESNHNASLVLTEVFFGWVSKSNDFIKGLEERPDTAAK